MLTEEIEDAIQSGNLNFFTKEVWEELDEDDRIEFFEQAHGNKNFDLMRHVLDFTSEDNRKDIICSNNCALARESALLGDEKMLRFFAQNLPATDQQEMVHAIDDRMTYLAATRNHINVLEFLFSYAKTAADTKQMILNPNGDNAIIAAAENGHLDMTILLLAFLPKTDREAALNDVRKSMAGKVNAVSIVLSDEKAVIKKTEEIEKFSKENGVNLFNSFKQLSAPNIQSGIESSSSMEERQVPPTAPKPVSGNQSWKPGIINSKTK